jgi:hypothetical protein
VVWVQEGVDFLGALNCVLLRWRRCFSWHSHSTSSLSRLVRRRVLGFSSRVFLLEIPFFCVLVLVLVRGTVTLQVYTPWPFWWRRWFGSVWCSSAISGSAGVRLEFFRVRTGVARRCYRFVTKDATRRMEWMIDDSPRLATSLFYIRLTTGLLSCTGVLPFRIPPSPPQQQQGRRRVPHTHASI